jgi:hypothetical protein
MDDMKIRSLLCLLLAACGGPVKETRPAPKSQPAASTPSSAATLDARSFVDFSKEWAEIAALTNEEHKRTRALSMLSSWKDRSYEWEGYIVASLCQDAKRCSINVIDRKKAQRPELLGGFFPALELTDEGLASLRKGCQGKPGCVVRFSGTLRDLSTDPELPLGMTFSSVNILTTRDASAEDAWWQSGPNLTLPADFKPGSVPLGNPNEPPLPPLSIKITEKVF